MSFTYNLLLHYSYPFPPESYRATLRAGLRGIHAAAASSKRNRDERGNAGEWHRRRTIRVALVRWNGAAAEAVAGRDNAEAALRHLRQRRLRAGLGGFAARVMDVRIDKARHAIAGKDIIIILIHLDTLAVLHPPCVLTH